MITGLAIGFAAGLAIGLARYVRRPRPTTTTQVCHDCGLSVTSPVDYLRCPSCRSPLAAGAVA